MSIPRILSSIGVLLLLAQSPLSADVVVLNDDFSTGEDYSLNYFTFADPPFVNPSDFSYADFEILENGGNPDDVFGLMHYHDVDRDPDSGEPIDGNGETDVFSFAYNNDVEYNPFTEGSFNSVTFSFEYRTFDADIGSVFAHMRNGAGNGNFAGSEVVVADGQWQTYSETFDNADFFLMDFSGAANVGLQFGFGFSSFLDVTDASEEVMLLVEVDNFSVSLSSVPEPGSLGILGLAALLVVGRRRRK